MAKISLKTVYLEKNQGHGKARREALAHCSHELVALMDADDISLPLRFEKQLEAFQNDPALSIVGGQIAEFSGAEEHVTGYRVVPHTDEEIRRYMRRRCPMNQVSVMFRKAEVARAGGYIDWPGEEDYYLWLRMAEAGCRFANVPDTLVRVRAGDEMNARRGGWEYFRSERKLQRWMLRRRVIGPFLYLYNVSIRFGAQVLAGAKLRKLLYRMTRSHDTAAQRADIEAWSGESKPASEPFSVALCVYAGDRADWFGRALQSLREQTVPPTEIVLVADGPITQELEELIERFRLQCESEDGAAE